MKNEEHKYGIYLKLDDKIEIRGLADSDSLFPWPSSEILAAFSSVNEMVDAGWVLD